MEPLAFGFTAASLGGISIGLATALMAVSLVALGTIYTENDIIKNLINVGLLDASGGPKLRPPKAKTADYTVLAASDPSGTLFTNRGATATVIFTLPAASQALAGCFYEFLGIADFTITVKPSAVDTLLVKNDLTADSLSAQTAGEIIGARMRAECDGTVWVCYGLSVGHTFTVAT